MRLKGNFYFQPQPTSTFIDFLRELKTCKSKMDTQSKQVSEYATRMDEYDKKFEENSRKFGTLLAVSYTNISLENYFWQKHL